MFRKKKYRPKVDILLPEDPNLANAIEQQVRDGTLSDRAREIVINETIAERQKFTKYRRQAEKERWKRTKQRWRKKRPGLVSDETFTANKTVLDRVEYRTDLYGQTQKDEIYKKEEYQESWGCLGMIFDIFWAGIIWPIWHYLVEYPLLWIKHILTLNFGFIVLHGESRTARIVSSKWVILPLFLGWVTDYMSGEYLFGLLLFLPATFIRFSFIAYFLFIATFVYTYMDIYGYTGWIFLAIMTLLYWQIIQEKRKTTTTDPVIVARQVNGELNRLVAFYRKRKR